MAIRTLLNMGNPLIYKHCEKISVFNTPELHELATDLLDTQRAHQGVGIAANQIGVSKQMMIYGFDEMNPRYPDKNMVPITVCINPVYEVLDATIEKEGEGCLCLPGLYGIVPRVHKIKLTYFDFMGEQHEVIEQGFAARIVQHECDHLQGKIYPMRIEDWAQFGFRDEIIPLLQQMRKKADPK